MIYDAIATDCYAYVIVYHVFHSYHRKTQTENFMLHNLRITGYTRGINLKLTLNYYIIWLADPTWGIKLIYKYNKLLQLASYIL